MKKISNDHAKFLQNIKAIQDRLIAMTDLITSNRDKLLNGTAEDVALHIAAEFESIGVYWLNVASCGNYKAEFVVAQGRNIAKMYGLTL